MFLYTLTAGRVEVLKRIFWVVEPPRRQGLAAILLLYLALATAYLAVVPPLEGFDALAHMNAINYWRQEQAPPIIDLVTNQYSYELLTQPPLYYMLSALVTSWLPADDADLYVRASANRYFPGLSKRQSIDLPSIPQMVGWAMLLARLVALLGGVLTVTATWLWVQTVLPDQRWLPTAVAAVVAFNPLFLFSSTAITNDAWAAAGTVVVIWLVTATAVDPVSTNGRWFLVGAVAGLAALTKYSVLLVAIPALLILIQYRCYRPVGRFVAIVAALFGGALLTAGWWYGRNLLFYGQPVPLTAMSTVITTLQRPTLMPLDKVWELLPFLFDSYWGLFLATFAPERFFQVMRWAVLLAVVGLPLGLFVRRWPPAYPRVLWIALVWFSLNLVSMINYMRLISYGEQARFLLTAAPAIGLLLVVGWQAWLPVRLTPALRLALLPLLIGFALWPLATLRAAYAQPPLLAAVGPTRPIVARFADGPRVLGYDLPHGAALAPGASLPLTLYFTADQPIAGDYTFFLHLVDSEDRLLYQYDGVPYGSRHPTRQWQPGQTFADSYTVHLATPVITDTLVTLLMGFYEYEAPSKRLSAFDGTATAIGDRIVLGKLRLLADPPDQAAVAVVPLAQWAGGIELLDATVEPHDPARYTVQLIWRSTALLAIDYTVFVQFLDANNQVVAQLDQQPRNGQSPTSTWLINEQIDDRYELPVPEAWSTMIVGLYDAQNGQRLARVGSRGGQDFFVIE